MRLRFILTVAWLSVGVAAAQPSQSGTEAHGSFDTAAGVNASPGAAGFVTTGSCLVLYGTGAPAIAAPVCSLYLRTDGGASSTLYVKESGTSTTGWTAK